MTTMQKLVKEVQALNCTCRPKSAHGWNAITFERVAELCDDTIKVCPGFFRGLTEAYMLAAHKDYDLHTGKQLTMLARVAKLDLLWTLQSCQRDMDAGLMKKID